MAYTACEREEAAFNPVAAFFLRLLPLRKTSSADSTVVTATYWHKRLPALLTMSSGNSSDTNDNRCSFK